jgi:2-oxoglutarate ferredoxin oxidoreductase subunit alpha
MIMDMRKELTIRISGEAGQGMQTIGQALGLIYKSHGLNMFANQDYMSRIRGGNNFFQIRISDEPLYTLRSKVDIVVALDRPSVAIHKVSLNDRGIIILDKKKFNVSEEEDVFFDVPIYDLAAKIGGSEIFINSAACGVLSAMTGVKFGYVENILKSIFGNKSEEVITKNIKVARAGYDFVSNSPRNNAFQIKSGQPRDDLLMNGNEAISIGAIRAGCKFYSAYPMTPSTTIMNVMAHYANKYNIIVEQAEDEMAAINMAIGASFAGVRAMTATSGGGFSLMVEGISLSGMTETPVVVVDAQRPAPATGFPTRTEQADLDFLIHAGHGEFARVVFSPGTIEEAFYLTVKAFNLAEKYQIPVLIMTDQHLADSCRNIGMFDLNRAKVERYLISKEDSKNIINYKRYQLTESGISPRAIPSWTDEVVYADSDEHTEEGHITEDAKVRTAMVEKRLYKKMAALGKEIEKPTAVNVEEAELVLIGFGSTYGVLKETSQALRDKKIGFVHLSQVWPFPEQEIFALLSAAKKKFTVENNASGQLARLIRRETGLKVDKSILKFDGRPFDLDFLVERIQEEA